MSADLRNDVTHWPTEQEWEEVMQVRQWPAAEL